ncbi:MAG: diaminopimelate epimerase [Chlamydiota bacterium]
MYKYQQAGNVFVVIDDLTKTFPRDKIATTCQEASPCDGLLLLQRSSKADFKMSIFNRDGGKASMCGNGICCLMKYIVDNGLAPERCTIETDVHIAQLNYHDGLVSTTMPQPSSIQHHDEVEGYFINTGVPHLVIFVEKISCTAVKEAGKQLRHHPLFAPHGTNVNFVEVLESSLKVRTYERGVENETQACGTGATASALVAQETYKLSLPLTVENTRGDTLIINSQDNNKIITLSGKPQKA